MVLWFYLVTTWFSVLFYLLVCTMYISTINSDIYRVSVSTQLYIHSTMFSMCESFAAHTSPYFILPAVYCIILVPRVRLLSIDSCPSDVWSARVGKNCRSYNSPQKILISSLILLPKIPDVLITSWVQDLIIEFIGCISSPHPSPTRRCWDVRCWNWRRQ